MQAIHPSARGFSEKKTLCIISITSHDYEHDYEDNNLSFVHVPHNRNS